MSAPVVGGAPPKSPGRRRGFRPLVDLPVLIWLTAAVVVALIHPLVPAPRWLMLHLVLLGAISNAILVWSNHFTHTLLHVPEGDRRGEQVRLSLLNAGVVAVLVGVVAEIWPITLVGAAGVAVAVLWHGWSLVRLLRTSLPARFGRSVRYYVAAACLLPVGAAFGVLLARSPEEPWHARLELAHAAVNLLGWVGLTVVGTLITLWPTILRTRISERAERDAGRALPVLVTAIVITVGGSLVDRPLVAAGGLAVYLVGLGLTGPSFVDTLRRRPPTTFPAWSVLAGVSWLVGCLIALTIGLGMASSWTAAGSALTWLTPYLAVGFGLQVLFGALAYLVPVKLSRGPSRVRALNAVMDRGGPLRITMTNAGLLVCVLPVPSVVRVLASMMVLGALVTWLILILITVKTSRRLLRAEAAEPGARADAVDRSQAGTRHLRSDRAGVDTSRPAGQATGLAALGLALIVLAVATGVAVDPAAAGAGSGTAAADDVQPTGQVTTVDVTAQGMRFEPSTITVPAGNRLVIRLTNTDADVHDLVLDTGQQSGRLGRNGTATIDVGVVGRAIEGWCSMLGHRQMGMVLNIQVTGLPASGETGAGEAGPEGSVTGDRSESGHNGGHGTHADPGNTGGEKAASAADDLDFMAKPPADFTAHDAVLPPLGTAKVHRRTFTVRDVVREVAPGVTQTQWTYDGEAPGPVLHGRVGDEFVITLVNRGTVGHSIDFHASALSPQKPMRTIAPGESLVYRFRANRAGIWMYHCSTMPMSAHIASGLYGAVVIEPPDLPKVDRSYVLVQSELYLGPQGGSADAAKLQAERPDAVVFNGYVNQYDHRPLTAKVGERVRIWVLDVGPNRPSSFHIVGAQFDTTYAEGTYLLRGGPKSVGGAQSLGLQAAQGGFVELSFPEPGDYPVVSHLMIDAERGAHGLVHVTR